MNGQGFPAPRCTYAKVSYNGNYCGLFKIVEQVDKKFLNTHFGNKDGNLFKGDPNGTLEWKGAGPSAYYNDYELKTNEAVNDWSDLVDLIRVLNADPATFASEAGTVFNVSSYLKMWAMNNLFVNLDAYYYLAHNYYLYHNTGTGQFDWITWDVSTVCGVFPLWSETKAVNLDLFYIPKFEDSRPLSKNLLHHDGYRLEYLQYVCSYLYNDLDPSKLFPKIDSLAGRIREAIYAEPDSNQMYREDQFENNLGYETVSAFLWGDIPGLKSFITNRRKEVIVQLCEKGWSCATNSLSNDGAVLMYPNPTSLDVTLRFDLVEDDAPITYSFIDLSGREVLSQTVYLKQGQNQHTLNIGSLPSGVYLLKISNSCKNFIRKLVVIQ